MRILLGGGAGYIGSALTPVLLERGYDVEVIDLCWFGNHLPKDVPVKQKELFDCVEDDFKGFDQVIFLAGLSNDPMADFDPSLNFKLNAALPSYLAFMAKRAGVRRFIYASSCSVYGYTVNELYDEDSPVSCNYPYGISKLQGERGVQQLADDDFSVISLRQGTVSGYSPRMRFDLIANAMFKSAITTGTLTVNNPSIWRPILDIRDAVTAYLRAIQADFSLSGVYNVASDNYTVGQVGDMVQQGLQRLGHGKVGVDIKAIQDFRNYKVTFNRAKTYLGYAPQYTVEDTIEHVFNHRDEYGDFTKDEFYNIKVFEGLAAAKAW